MSVEERLSSYLLGPLPKAPVPAGAYTPVALAGKLAFVSGQIPISDGSIRYRGAVSADNVAEGRESARLCALNVLSQLKAKFGSLDRVSNVVRITGYVNSGPGFTDQPTVMDGASEMIAAAFGPKTHARVAIGVSSLPMNAMTEVDAIAELS